MYKKILFAMVMTLLVISPLLAGEKKADPNVECYNKVKDLLSRTQFNSVLPDAFAQEGTDRVFINCTDNSKGFGRIDPGSDLKPGDRVATLSVDASVVITVQPRIQSRGRLVGLLGTEETVHVQGTSGYYYKSIHGATFFDVSKFSYRKTNLESK